VRQRDTHFEENFAQLAQTLQRIELACREAATVGPLVIARDVNQRHRRGIEQGAAVEENVIAATRRTALEIAGMDDKRRMLLGDVAQNALVEHFFTRQRTLLRRQRLVLEGFQLGRDVAFGVLQRLPAAVIVGTFAALALLISI
jgi:hypothetical protein